MTRRLPVLAGLLVLLAPGSLRADAFDRYTNPVLAAAPGARGVQEVKQLTPALIADNDGVLPQTTGALLIVHTNDNRFSKLLVRAARQKAGDKTFDVLLIDRFVTYKEAEDRAVKARGEDIDLFPGFLFNLDIGQVVPPEVGGDLRFVAEGNKVHTEPVGKAKLYLVTRPLPGTEPRKSSRPTAGQTFEPRFFTGTYHLELDGRSSGELTLEVADGGGVSGAFYSDRDGQKYDVTGKVGSPSYTIDFTIKFPRSEEVFHGWLFTGNGKALTGYARLQEHEVGFYALRAEGQ